MKIRVILLLLLIGYDWSLHLVELLNKETLYPLYITFPIFNFITYNIFWTIYWGVAFVITLTLLGMFDYILMLRELKKLRKNEM